MLRSVAVLIAATGFVMSTQAQAISFNAPLPWVTLRNDSLTVRAQVDTATLKGKEISLSLLSVANGKTSSIATKKVKLSEPSSEFSFGKINKTLVGGDSYLKVTWAIKGTEEKGEIEPVGIADLSVIKAADALKAVRVGDNAAASEIAAKVKNGMMKTGNVSFGLAWNKNKFSIVVGKGTAGDSLVVALDGKCGKNAFLSYPDRMVEIVFGEKVTVDGFHYERSVKENRMSYERNEWQNEITSEVSGDVTVISMPWYDSGIIPFEDRTIGAAVFTAKNGATAATATPASAERLVPATWGVILLQK